MRRYVVRGSGAISGVSNSIYQIQIMTLRGCCIRPESMGGFEDKGSGRALCKDLIVHTHVWVLILHGLLQSYVSFGTVMYELIQSRSHHSLLKAFPSDVCESLYKKK